MVVWTPSNVWAHCDTLSGPVIKDARTALERKDVTTVLKWVSKGDEKEIHQLFQKTLVVRAQSEDAKNLADMYFFETLVRIHRAGEGAPYTGLKAAGSIEPGIEMADESIVKGSVAGVLRDINKKIEEGVRTRFEKVVETKKHANDSIEAGREFVEAYVDYLHFVENINAILSTKTPFNHGNEIKNLEDKHNR
jgi:hypothetical protein